jgi:antitoxin CptB
MDSNLRLKRLRFRAWHRGTREADLVVGGYFDRHHRDWSEADIDWFERLLEEQDVDILAWAFGTSPPPERFDGDMMLRLKQLNYIKNPE